MVYLLFNYYRKKYRKQIGYTNKKTDEYLYCLYVPFLSLKVGKSTLLKRRFQNHKTALRKLRIVGIIPVSNCEKSESTFEELFNRVGSTEHYNFDPRIFMFFKLASDHNLVNQINQQFKEK